MQMSAALTLAKLEHFNHILPLVNAHHDEAKLTINSKECHAAVRSLLQGIPQGAAYLIGPPKAPIGYIIITFSWSIKLGGMDGWIDEIYVRPNVRRRGIAGEVLTSLPKALLGAGLKGLHAKVSKENSEIVKIYESKGFVLDKNFQMMQKIL